MTSVWPSQAYGGTLEAGDCPIMRWTEVSFHVDETVARNRDSHSKILEADAPSAYTIEQA